MKTQLPALVVHRLRSPLAIVGWYVELLLSKTTGHLGIKQKEYLHEIYQANKKMLALINRWGKSKKERVK